MRTKPSSFPTSSACMPSLPRAGHLAAGAALQSWPRLTIKAPLTETRCQTLDHMHSPGCLPFNPHSTRKGWGHWPHFLITSFILSELFKTFSNLPRVIQRVHVKLYLDSGLAPSLQGGQMVARGRRPPSLPKPREVQSTWENNGFIKDPTAWLHSLPTRMVPSMPDTLSLGSEGESPFRSPSPPRPPPSPPQAQDTASLLETRER